MIGAAKYKLSAKYILQIMQEICIFDQYPLPEFFPVFAVHHQEKITSHEIHRGPIYPQLSSIFFFE